MCAKVGCRHQQKLDLTISETRVWMEGNSDVHANAGSTVVLKCHIAGTLQKPDFVFWYESCEACAKCSLSVHLVRSTELL